MTYVYAKGNREKCIEMRGPFGATAKKSVKLKFCLSGKGAQKKQRLAVAFRGRKIYEWLLFRDFNLFLSGMQKLRCHRRWGEIQIRSRWHSTTIGKTPA